MDTTLTSNTGKLLHELGNIVNWLNGHVFLLKKILDSQETPLPPAAFESFEAIHQASLRLTDILKNNKLVTQDGMGPSSKPEVVTVKSAIDSLAASLGFQRSVSVDTNGIAPDLELRVDRTAFIQIMLNLLTNAADAIADQAVKSITAEVVTTRCAVELRISNNGPLIPETHQQRIFEPFFTTKRTGHGLGLMICRTLAEKNGWLLRLDSAAPRTTFVLSFPAESCRPA